MYILQAIVLVHCLAHYNCVNKSGIISAKAKLSIALLHINYVYYIILEVIFTCLKENINYIITIVMEESVYWGGFCLQCFLTHISVDKTI